MSAASYRLIDSESQLVPVKAWVDGVMLDSGAEKQLVNVAKMPFVQPWVAAMPDVHWGMGATIGSVIPSVGAIIPAAVGVDIGCGMMAVQTSMSSKDLPEDLHEMRTNIEKKVPHGRTNNGGKGDRGAWHDIPLAQQKAWEKLKPGFESILKKHPKFCRADANHVNHLGTLGTGNHFIEVCLDEHDHVWVMLHSGSRGIGNRIGTYFIELAKKDMARAGIDLPDQDLAYLSEGTAYFDDYIEAVEWAQRYATLNRELMMAAVLEAIRQTRGIPQNFKADVMAVNCHHNYVAREKHYGKEVLLTRKGAVRAGKGELGIIPGSMGARSYIVRGLGNPESFESCSHGAGRMMSRGEAKRKFSLEEHRRATEGVECRKDADVLDETPGAYKPIDAVMHAQKDLVEVVHTLKQIVCVKG